MKFKIFRFKKVKSTNNTAIRIIRNTNYNHGMIISKIQSNGRGQYGKKWISYNGNLFVSFFYKLDNLTVSFNQLTKINCLLVKRLLSLYYKKKIIFKKPNDLLINKKKIAGILIDSISKGNKICELYVGIGINAKIAPPNLNYETTCLKDVSTITISRMKVLSKLIFYFNYWEKVFQNKSFIYIANCWMERSLPINSRISFKDNNKIINGIYKGISETGSIRILINNKECNFFNLETIV